MHNPTAKDRTTGVQNLSSEHLIWPQRAGKGLHLSVQKRLAQKQKLCSLYIEGEPTTHHLTQGARKSKDIINIFKQVKYDHKSMLQEL